MLIAGYNGFESSKRHIIPGESQIASCRGAIRNPQLGSPKWAVVFLPKLIVLCKGASQLKVRVTLVLSGVQVT